MTIVDAFGTPIASGHAVTEKYTPGPRFLWGQQPRDLPLFSFEMVKYMLLDQTIKLGLAMRAAPLCAAEFGYDDHGTWTKGVRADREDVKAFVESQLRTIWDFHIHKLLGAQVWGWAGGELTYKTEAVPGTSKKRIVIDDLLEVHPADCRALKRNGKLAGVRVTGIRRDLSVPGTGYWHAFTPDPRSFYGRGVLIGAYSAWADKWLDGGALDVRRVFMHTDAYGGMRIGYPPGMIDIDGKGEDIPNRDIAREIVEQYRSGNVQTFPNVYDEKGNKLWTVEDARVTGNPGHILQYPKDLDVEMLRGLEIPDDVLTAEATGSWQGKQVPMQAFYQGLNRWLYDLVAVVKRQALEPLVLWNFGRAEDFHVEAKPLDKQAMEQTQAAQQPPGEQQPGAGGLQDMLGGGGSPDTGEAAVPGMPSAMQPKPQQMGLDPVAAVGAGVLSATHLVKAARRLLDERDPFAIAEQNLAIHNEQPLDNQNKYGCLMLMLTGDVAERVKRLAQDIAIEDLTEDGIEHEPHITVKWGLVTDEAEQIRQALSACGPVAIRIGRTSVFQQDDCDVVKLDVDSRGLHELNGQVSATCACEETYPTYVPHITLGYVKAGRGKKYAGLADLAGTSVAFDDVVFSDRSRNKFYIPLHGAVRFSFDESKVKRDQSGEFSKQAGSGAAKQDHLVFDDSEDGPEELHGIRFSSWTPPADDDWNRVDGQKHDLDEPPMRVEDGQRASSGVVITEPDGRVWIYEPTDHYGDYEHTFPKGGIEDELHPQANAIKEAYEETGLKVQITDLLGDYEGDTSVTRYYLATRTGGTPEDRGREAQAVKLVPPMALREYLNRSRDRRIAKDLHAKVGGQQRLAFDEAKVKRDAKGEFSATGDKQATGTGGDQPTSKRRQRADAALQQATAALKKGSVPKAKRLLDKAAEFGATDEELDQLRTSLAKNSQEKAYADDKPAAKASPAVTAAPAVAPQQKSDPLVSDMQTDPAKVLIGDKVQFKYNGIFTNKVQSNKRVRQLDPGGERSAKVRKLWRPKLNRSDWVQALVSFKEPLEVSEDAGKTWTRQDKSVQVVVDMLGDKIMIATKDYRRQGAQVLDDHPGFKKAPKKGLQKPLQMAAERSPKGGVTINGQFYTGGQFIPAAEMEKASVWEQAEFHAKKSGKQEAAADKPGFFEAEQAIYKVLKHAESFNDGGTKQAIDELHDILDMSDTQQAELYGEIHDAWATADFHTLKGKLNQLKIHLENSGDEEASPFDVFTDAVTAGDEEEAKASLGDIAGLIHGDDEEGHDIYLKMQGAYLTHNMASMTKHAAALQEHLANVNDLVPEVDATESDALSHIATAVSGLENNDNTKAGDAIWDLEGSLDPNDKTSVALHESAVKAYEAGDYKKAKVMLNTLQHHLITTSQAADEDAIADPITEVVAAQTTKEEEPEEKPAGKKKDDTKGFPESVSDLTEVKSLGGSTGAMLYEDQHGKQFVVKSGKHAAHIQEEYSADKIYEALGANVPTSVMIGKQKVSRFLDGVKPLSDLSASEQTKVAKQLGKHFAVDALLANWDVVGLDKDNILVTPDGTAYRADNGGSLRYRAQGGSKDAKFGETVPEVVTMRDPKFAAGAVFQHLSDADVAQQIRGLDKQRSTLLDATPPDLRAKLSVRLDDMLEWADKVDGGAAAYDATDKGGDFGDIVPTFGLDSKIGRQLDRAKKWATKGNIKGATTAIKNASNSLQKMGFSPDEITAIVSGASAGALNFLIGVSGNAMVGGGVSKPSSFDPAKRVSELGLPSGSKERHGFTPTTEWAATHSKWIAGFPSSQMKHITSYTGSGYSGLNANLRKCPKTLDCLEGSQRESVAAAAAAVDKAGPLPKGTILYRGSHGDSAGVKKLLSDIEMAIKSGGIVSLHGVQSTSTRASVAAGFSGYTNPVVFELVAKSGAYVKPVSIHPSEYEVLQKHGVKYRPLAIHKNVTVKNHGKQVTLIQMEEV